MDLQFFYFVGGLVVAGMALYNFVLGFGRTQGITEKQLIASDTRQDDLDRRLVSFTQAFETYKTITDERFSKLSGNLNDVLVHIARNHPTKEDVLASERRIIEHINFLLSVKGEKD